MLKLFAPSFAHSILQHAIAIIREELEGRGLAILLPHEQQRGVRSEQQESSGELARSARNERIQAISLGAIADLVMVLRADDVRGKGNARRESAAFASTPEFERL